MRTMDSQGALSILSMGLRIFCFSVQGRAINTTTIPALPGATINAYTGKRRRPRIALRYVSAPHRRSHVRESPSQRTPYRRRLALVRRTPLLLLRQTDAAEPV